MTYLSEKTVGKPNYKLLLKYQIPFQIYNLINYAVFDLKTDEIIIYTENKLYKKIKNYFSAIDDCTITSIGYYDIFECYIIKIQAQNFIKLIIKYFELELVESELEYIELAMGYGYFDIEEITEDYKWYKRVTNELQFKI